MQGKIVRKHEERLNFLQTTEREDKNLLPAGYAE